MGIQKRRKNFGIDFRVECPFDPERTLFIDDSESVLRAASTYGIAHLLSIAKPDSQRAPVTSAQFNSVGDFAEILSIAGNQ